MANKAEGTGGWGETLRTLFWAILIAVAIRTLFLPALLDPFGLDEGHAADRRLPVHQQDGLWLFAPFLPVFGLPVHPGTLVRLRARARRRGGVQAPANGADFIKRVIGLPGDRVQVRRAG
jgi:signal peptidase I